MRVAARWGDRWNGFVPTDPDPAGARMLLAMVDDACTAVDRDPGTLGRTVDIVVDPLDLRGARTRSRDALTSLAGLGLDEVRCYGLSHTDPQSRIDALTALRDLTPASV